MADDKPYKVVGSGNKSTITGPNFNALGRVFTPSSARWTADQLNKAYEEGRAGGYAEGASKPCKHETPEPQGPFGRH